MSIKLQLPKLADLKPRITVIGVGGAGCNAINNMIAAGLDGVDFVVANTDAQALVASSAEHRTAARHQSHRRPRRRLEARDRRGRRRGSHRGIRAQIAGSHMVFIAAGMGGGTGTGAAAVIARAAKELGILTVGVVTKPFQFEGARRMRIAEAGIAELRKYVDTLIVIPNQNLFRIANEKTTFAEAFVLADQVLYSGVACIVDLIIKEGLINLDFADVRTVMSGMGTAMMGTGEASGERPRHRCGRGGDRQSAARRRVAEGRQGPAAVDHRRPRHDAVRGRRGGEPRAPGGRSAKPTSSSAPRSTRRSATACASRSSPRAWRAWASRCKRRNLRRSIRASAWQRPQAQRRSRRLRRTPQRHEAARGYAPAQHHMAPDDDMQRRLSDAIGTDDAREQHAPQPSRETWRAPGNVVIEEGFSQMSWAPQQAPRGTAPRRDMAMRPAQFIPAPPADVRRGARRMPDVEDFPPVAQREYRAKASQAPHGASRPRSRRRRAAAARYSAADHGAGAPRRHGRPGDEQCRARPASHVKLVAG